jgi:hypothetical protein
MDLMNQIFHECLDFWVIECTDDMIVHSTNRVERERHLMIVLVVIKKGIPCQTHERWVLVEEVSFLAHVMNKNGLVTRTLEQERTITPVLRLSMKIMGMWFA